MSGVSAVELRELDILAQTSKDVSILSVALRRLATGLAAHPGSAK